LRVWVAGNGKKFELSEARDVELQPLGWELPRKPAAITSVSPFLIELMDEHSPEELSVTIEGENFVPENKVFVEPGNDSRNHKEVRSEYLSPRLLRAWIPRQLWRKHQISYRLVVETSSGQRYAQQVDDNGDDEWAACSLNSRLRRRPVLLARLPTPNPSGT
jgi:hypothetical protein